MKIYSYENEKEDQVSAKENRKFIDLIDYQEFSCQNTITVNGQEMTITEFKEMKNRG